MRARLSAAGWFGGVLCVVCVGPLVGCGGASDSTVSGEDGGADGTSSGMGENVVDGGATLINPGQLGSLVGGSIPDAGVASPPEGGAIPAQIVDGCTTLCTEEQAAGCAGFGSLGSCQVGCNLLLRNPACTSAAQSLFACASGATATCDSSGNPTFSACAAQELATDACVLLKATDTSLATPCATYCAGVSAAKCPDDSSQSACVGACPLFGNLFGCDAQWAQYVACANGSTLTCGSDGKASAAACLAQAASFWECAAGELLVASADGGS